MKSKFFAVATFAFAFAFALSAGAVGASEIYSASSGFLRVGSGMGAKAYQMPNVMAAQTALNACTGSSLNVDGKYGMLTEGVFKSFQTSKGIKADGIIGPVTAGQLAACSGTVTPTTPGSTTLEGGAGEATITSTTTDVEDSILEDGSEKIAGFKVEADGSDLSVTNVKVTLSNNDTGGSYRLSDYADSVDVYMGSTKVGSADASDFIKNSASASACDIVNNTQSCYSKSITLSNAVVKEGSNKKATFHVVVNAISNIDQDDIDNNSWDIGLDSFRYVDGTGAILTTNDEVTKNFYFTDLAGQGDLKLTVSKGGSSPLARNVVVSDTGSTSNVLMLEFKLKAEGSDMSFDSIDFDVSSNTSGADLEDIVSELTLKEGSSELATFSDISGDDVYTFDLDETYTIDKDTTKTFRVYAKVADVDNYASGDAVTVSFDDIAAEDSNTDVVSETGDANGTEQTFVIDVPTFSLEKTPTMALYTHTDGVTAGEEDLYKATFVINVTAAEGQDAYLPLDTFSYGTSGTAGVEYTVTGGATVTSAALSYSGDNDADVVDQTNNSYKVSEGTTEEFTFTVYLTGNDAQGKVSIGSVWYELTDATPNGTPEVTSGFTNFKTPSGILLAK